MKFSSIIMTAGISLFNRNNLYGGPAHEYEAFEFDRMNPLIKQSYDPDQTLDAWEKSMLKLNRDGKEKNISAEYSLLQALKVNNQLADNPNVTLFYTAIDNRKIGGYFAANLQKDIFEKDFHANVKLQELNNFSVTDKTKMKKSISEFMEKVVKELQNHEPYSTFFAPIGGYKVMTSFGYIAGSFVGYPTGYLHEDNQVLQIIPPVPIVLDEKLVEKNKEQLRNIIVSGSVPVNEVNYTLRDEGRFLFEIDGDELTLNALGEFLLLQKYPQYFDYEIHLERGVKLTPLVKNQISTLLEAAKDNRLSQERENLLHHESNLPTQSVFKDNKYHLFKGVSNGREVFRAIWKRDKDKKILWLPKIWLNHDRYEKDIKNKNKILSYLHNEVNNVSEEYYNFII